MIRRLLAVFVLAASACAPLPAPAPRHLPAMRTEIVEERDEERDVLDAAALAPLDSMHLPAGTREVRIWWGWSLGYPRNLYRLVERGGRVSGELLMYWSVRPPDTSNGESTGHTFADGVHRMELGRCGEFRRTAHAEVCRARFTRAPNWAGVLRRLESLGLWTLQDPQTLPYDSIVSNDGWWIGADLRDGAMFRSYVYGDPEAHASWRDAPRALAMTRVLNDSVGALIRPPSVYRRYRGVTSGAYRGAFRPCGRRATWELDSDLPRLARRAGVPLPTLPPGGEYYVEAIGDLMTRRQADRRDSRFGRILNLTRIVTVKPWTGRECG